MIRLDPALLDVAPEVADAVRAGAPVVALESTLITHGLPYPRNLEVATASEAAVRAAGAIPATVAVHAGRLKVGLAPDALETLGGLTDGSVPKAARPTLAAALQAGGWGSTTVSATMVAAAAAGIAVHATGGIGGVHRGAFGGNHPTLDVSSDLEELARTPLAVVCSGPKAILDVAGTVEWLETRGVPVVALDQDEVPGFWSRRSGVRAPARAAGVGEAAALARLHWRLGLGTAVLVCQPVPEAVALPLELVQAAVERAVADAAAAGIEGGAVTPWLLARVAHLTDGASVTANTALIVGNAGLAGRLAVALAAERG